MNRWIEVGCSGYVCAGSIVRSIFFAHVCRVAARVGVVAVRCLLLSALFYYFAYCVLPLACVRFLRIGDGGDDGDGGVVCVCMAFGGSLSTHLLVYGWLGLCSTLPYRSLA